MKSIEVITSQNVPLQYEVAKLADRIGAYVIDLLLIFGFYMLIFLIGGVGNIGNVLIITILFFVFYPFICEIFMNGQTFGKKALGIKVIKINSYDITLSDYAIRWIMGFVDITFSAGCLAVFLVNSSEKGQRLGDIIANTTVIKVKTKAQFKLNDLLNIQSIETYTPLYPGVVVFKEEDMLLVKNVLQRFKTYKNDAHREAVILLSDKIAVTLDLKTPIKNRIEFLNIVLKDYITLTR